MMTTGFYESFLREVAKVREVPKGNKELPSVIVYVCMCVCICVRACVFIYIRPSSGARSCERQQRVAECNLLLVYITLRRP
jgi:hypothetical protein